MQIIKVNSCRSPKISIVLEKFLYTTLYRPTTNRRLPCRQCLPERILRNRGVRRG